MSELLRNGTTYLNYKFYNEREWRYVPEFTHPQIKNRMSKLEYEEYKKANPKPHINEFSLKFLAEDIRYIILKNENEILDFINYLKDQTQLFGKMEEFELLKTKITTSERIIDDI